MGTLVDAVEPGNIPAELDGAYVLRITVLGDPQGQCFDVEGGNASPTRDAASIQARYRAGKASVVYVNQSTEGPALGALAAAGVPILPAGAWPRPGAYLWCADPSGNIPAGRWKPVVTPVAVQDQYLGTTDVSSTAESFPAAVGGYIDGEVSAWPAEAFARFRALPDSPAPTVPGPGPSPAPGGPTQQEVTATVMLPILKQGARGPSVKAAQRLLGGLAVDGIFGPSTHDVVLGFQHREGLTTDGVIGKHTWGALLGAPQ